MTLEGSCLFLGTGSSMGIPMIGCSCEVCQSRSRYNKRLRPSVLIEIDQKRFLVDIGPDFRTQALLHHIEHLDGVIITHAHQDHVGGIDDLRALYVKTRQPLPLLLSDATYQDLLMRFPYIFLDPKPEKKLTPKFKIKLLESERGSGKFQGIPFRYFSYEQMGMKVTGFRFGNFAYVTDIRHYPKTIFQDLKGVEVLILSALRAESNPIHFSIQEAAEFGAKVGAKKTWLTHIAHEVDHENTNRKLSEKVRLAYDGQTIKFKLKAKP